MADYADYKSAIRQIENLYSYGKQILSLREMFARLLCPFVAI